MGSVHRPGVVSVGWFGCVFALFEQVSRLLSTGLPPLVGTSPVTAMLTLRLNVRYSAGLFPVRLDQLAPKLLLGEDKGLVAAGSNRLLNVRAVGLAL